MSPSQDGELLPKSQVFQQQIAARARESGKDNDQEPKQAQHRTSLTRRQAKFEDPYIYLIRRQIGILARHRISSPSTPKLIECISPCLHHHGARFQVFRVVIGAGYLVLLRVSELQLDVFVVKALLVKVGRSD